jgi:hypothetical protein
MDISFFRTFALIPTLFRNELWQLGSTIIDDDAYEWIAVLSPESRAATIKRGLRPDRTFAFNIEKTYTAK